MNVKLFDQVVRLRVSSYFDEENGWSVEVALKVIMAGHEYMTAGDGDGPVNAMDNAICSVLRDHGLMAVNDLQLQDYHVEKCNNHGSAAAVTVTIGMSNHQKSTVCSATSTNQDEAAFVALCGCYEDLLNRKGE